MKYLIENGTGHNVARQARRHLYQEHTTAARTHTHADSVNVYVLLRKMILITGYISLCYGAIFSLPTIHAFTFLDESETIKVKNTLQFT